MIVSYNKIITMKQYQSSALSYLQHNKNRCYTIFFPSLLVNISVIEISLDLCDWNLLLISSMSGVNVCHNSIDINYALVSIQQQCYSSLPSHLWILFGTNSRSNVLSIMRQPFCQCSELTVLQSKNLFLETGWMVFIVFSDMFNILPFTKPRSCRLFLTSHKTC